MIDPDDVTKFDRTDWELEEFLLFCIVVAGKTSYVQTKKLEQFLNLVQDNISPLDKIKKMRKDGKLYDNLKSVGMGQYNRLYSCFDYCSVLFGGKVKGKSWLKSCSIDTLESVPGIGPKTSRFFIMHSRKNQEVAALDTHILRWMRDTLNIETPDRTPTGKRYAELEKIFVNVCKKANKSVADMDLEIWKKYARRAA